MTDKRKTVAIEPVEPAAIFTGDQVNELIGKISDAVKDGAILVTTRTEAEKARDDAHERITQELEAAARAAVESLDAEGRALFEHVHTTNLRRQQARQTAYWVQTYKLSKQFGVSPDEASRLADLSPEIRARILIDGKSIP